MSGAGSKSPKKVANVLSAILRQVLGEQRFPVDVETLAKEYTQHQPDPITKVVGDSLPGFQGMLRPGRNKPSWHIIYNNNTEYAGRERFTLAHELGHYLLHRPTLTAADYAMPQQNSFDAISFTCNPLERNRWKSYSELIEEEADIFASYLLMPLDDLRLQTQGRVIDRELLQHLTSRYGTSLTACLRRWIEFTPDRAAMIVARDGFALWGRASRSAVRSGIFIPSGMELPSRSVAALGPSANVGEKTKPIQHPAGIWSFKSGSEPVSELTFFSERLGLSITLLQFPDLPIRDDIGEESQEWDAYDQFERFG